MRARLSRFFTVVGVITTGLCGLLLMVMTVRCIGGPDVPKRTVLELRLDGPVVDGGASSAVSSLLGGETTHVRTIVEALERGASDERVAGMVVYVDDVAWGMAIVQEVRDAILRFRDAGKFAVCFSESFGELSPGNQGYYVATACDEIYLQPNGAVGLTGLMTESYFVKGALELAGVQAQGDHRHEYKNALNMFTERRFTEAHREAAQTLVDDLFDAMVGDIAAAREIDEATLRAAADRGPLLSDEAEEAGLVDGLLYRDQVLAKVMERAGEDAQRLYAQVYLERAGSPWDDGPKIALVSGAGVVSRGSSSYDVLMSEETMGSDTIAGAIRAAVADEDVVAIVLRVDSPGGSPVASEVIWREVKVAREAGKPVIVSMGNVAASGGYYMAAGATKIVAQPSTITGSIGVLAGKPVTTKAWNRIGVTWDWVKSSEHADFFSHLEPYDADEWAHLGRWLDRIYEEFKARVAEGRDMSPDAVEKVARGRVWSGKRAKAHGLVDELGGLHEALALARTEAGLDADAQFELAIFPPPQGIVSQLIADSPDNSGPPSAMVVTGARRWRSVAQRAAALGVLDGDRGVLLMSPLAVGP